MMMTLQIGVGDEVDVDELMDVASEPHEFSIYTATNFSALTDSIVNRFSNILCNSNHLNTILFRFVFACDVGR